MWSWKLLSNTGNRRGCTLSTRKRQPFLLCYRIRNVSVESDLEFEPLSYSLVAALCVYGHFPALFGSLKSTYLFVARKNSINSCVTTIVARMGFAPEECALGCTQLCCWFVFWFDGSLFLSTPMFPPPHTHPCFCAHRASIQSPVCLYTVPEECVCSGYRTEISMQYPENKGNGIAAGSVVRGKSKERVGLAGIWGLQEASAPRQWEQSSVEAAH